MPLNAKAQEVAQLDAICDEFERAISAGEVTLGDGPECLETWVERASPPLRDWLLEELRAIGSDFGAANADPESRISISNLRIYWSIERDAWPSPTSVYHD